LTDLRSKLRGDKIAIVNEILNKYLSGKDFAIVLFSLSLFFIASLQLFNDANNWMLYKYDDVDHLSYSYNLFHGNGLQKGIIDLEANTLDKNIPALSKHDEINTHLIGKNPFYFVLLGVWLYSLGANFENWFFYGSIFNLILTSLCIVAFYMLAKKCFGLGVALFTTPILATMPGLIWFAVRIRPDVLLLLLIILGIYAGLRKITPSNAVITGVLVALAHFTHPLGLVLGLSILIFYLAKRKFGESALLFITWLTVLVPWLIRNYLIFGDPIRGFGLPIPRSILTYLGLASSDAPQLEVYPDSFHSISVIDTLSGMVNEFSNLYGMEYFLLFISLSIVSFISFFSLKRAIVSKRKNKYVFCFGIITYSMVIGFMLFEPKASSNVIIPIVVIFVIPFLIFIYIKLFSSYKSVFTTKENPALMLIGIYAVMNFVVYIMYTQISGRVTPEIRIILISLYMLLPLAILGMKTILYNVFQFFNEKHRSAVVFVAMVILLATYSSYQSYTGLTVVDSRLVDLSAERYQVVLNSWIRENIPDGSNVASDMPHLLTLQTGLNSVNFAHAYKDNTSYENWIIKKFDIDYLVFYYYKYDGKPLSIVDIGDLKLQKLFQGKDGGLVYKISER